MRVGMETWCSNRQLRRPRYRSSAIVTGLNSTKGTISARALWRLFSQRSHFTVFGTKVDGLAELAGEKNNGEIKEPLPPRKNHDSGGGRSRNQVRIGIVGHF